MFIFSVILADQDRATTFRRKHRAPCFEQEVQKMKCKARSKKSNSDKFKFHVILAGSDMVKNNDMAAACRCNFKTLIF